MQGALGRTEIRQIQGQIRVQDAHQGHIGEIQPLCDHLRADQDVDLLRPEIPQQVTQLVFALDRVRIHTGDPRVCK